MILHERAKYFLFVPKRGKFATFARQISPLGDQCYVSLFLSVDYKNNTAPWLTASHLPVVTQTCHIAAAGTPRTFHFALRSFSTAIYNSYVPGGYGSS
jgi:hypothetical protein